MTEQLSILEGERLRDESIVRVAQANPSWSDEAYDAVVWIAERRDLFTSDAVWILLGLWGVEEPTDRRALGPVLKRAANAELIEPTGRWHLSQRSVCHRAPKRVYASLIFGQGRALRGGTWQGEETGDGR